VEKAVAAGEAAGVGLMLLDLPGLAAIDLVVPA
jgi:hypothetical protein